MTQAADKQTSAPDPNRARYRAALMTAVLAGAFCVAAGVLMARAHVGAWAMEFTKSADLDTLRAEMQKPGADRAAIRNQIRDRDLQIRSDMYYREWFANRGGYLILAGGIVLVIAANRAAAWRPRRKTTRETIVPGAQRRTSALARWAVLAVAAVTCGSAAALAGLLAATPLPDVPDAGEKAGKSTRTAAGGAAAPTTPATPYPSDDEIRKQWPRFRGPFGLGTSTYTNIPTAWDGKTGKGILWKSPVPLAGENSPVVWGDRIFLAGATAAKREVYCFSLADGKLLWTSPVETPGDATSTPPEVMDVGGFCASTAATDGRYVAAIFANGDMACFSVEGKPVWVRNIGPFNTNKYGYGTSLTMYHDTIIAQIDQGSGTKTNSVLYAFNVLTGMPVWQTKRPVPASWATPILVNTGQREEFITCAKPWMIAYDPAKGTELWRAQVLDGDVVPSPAYAGGVVYEAVASAKAVAVRTGGSGDVTDKNVLWMVDDGLPDVVSLVSDGKFVLRVTSQGILTCSNPADGKTVWDKEMEMSFMSSPTLVGDKVYLLNDKGVMYIFAAGGTAYKEIGHSALGEEPTCTPAYLDGKILIRAKKNLYCIGEK
jgi:outer membrane protein assembly factor BamB